MALDFLNNILKTSSVFSNACIAKPNTKALALDCLFVKKLCRITREKSMQRHSPMKEQPCILFYPSSKLSTVFLYRLLIQIRLFRPN